MSKWKYHIDISDLHTAYEKNELAIPALAQRVAERIRASDAFQDTQHHERLTELADEFCEIDDDPDWYDSVLNELYNWGDTWLDPHPLGEKLCWINTIPVPEE